MQDTATISLDTGGCPRPGRTGWHAAPLSTSASPLAARRFGEDAFSPSAPSAPLLRPPLLHTRRQAYAAVLSQGIPVFHSATRVRQSRPPSLRTDSATRFKPTRFKATRFKATRFKAMRSKPARPNPHRPPNRTRPPTTGHATAGVPRDRTPPTHTSTRVRQSRPPNLRPPNWKPSDSGPSGSGLPGRKARPGTTGNPVPPLGTRDRQWESGTAKPGTAQPRTPQKPHGAGTTTKARRTNLSSKDSPHRPHPHGPATEVPPQELRRKAPPHEPHPPGPAKERPSPDGVSGAVHTGMMVGTIMGRRR